MTFTFGGIKIGEKSEVLDKTMKAIPGVYAACEITGGFFTIIIAPALRLRAARSSEKLRDRMRCATRIERFDRGKKLDEVSGLTKSYPRLEIVTWYRS